VSGIGWLHSVQQPFFGHLISDSRSIFCDGFLSFQGTYLGTLVTSWLGYFRFGNSLLLNRSWISHFLSIGSGNASCSFVMSCYVPREHPPYLLGRGHHNVYFACLAVILGQWPKVLEEICGSHSSPSGCHFWSFTTKQNEVHFDQNYPWSINLNCKSMYQQKMDDELTCFLFSSKLVPSSSVCRKGRNTSIKLREASWSASLGVKLPFVHT
jgi:hypothetical protein